VDGFHWVFRLL